MSELNWLATHNYGTPGIQFLINENKQQRLLPAAVDIISRIIAALFGGYALAHTLPALLVAVWPMARAEAVLTAIQLSFLVYVMAVIWVFAASTACRAWIGLGITILLTGLPAWWLV